MQGGIEISPVPHHVLRNTQYETWNISFPWKVKYFLDQKKFIMATIPQALAIALRHHQSGNLQQAEQIYRQILQAEPNHPDALHLLGVIAHQLGENEVAIRYIDKAISVNPSDPNFHINLGAAYQAFGRLDRRWPATGRH